MGSEHLILIVALVIVVNRLFDQTGLKRYRPAYVAVQLFDLACVGVLSAARIPELPTKADFIIRIFLMLFVAYHMVINNKARDEAIAAQKEALASGPESVTDAR